MCPGFIVVKKAHLGEDHLYQLQNVIFKAMLTQPNQKVTSLIFLFHWWVPIINIPPTCLKNSTWWNMKCPIQFSWPLLLSSDSAHIMMCVDGLYKRMFTRNGLEYGIKNGGPLFIHFCRLKIIRKSTIHNGLRSRKMNGRGIVLLYM